MDFDFTSELLVNYICDALMLIIIVYLGLKMEKLTSYTKKLLDIMEKRERRI